MLLYFCFTTALLLIYYCVVLARCAAEGKVLCFRAKPPSLLHLLYFTCFTSTTVHILTTVRASCTAFARSPLLYYCFTDDLLLLYCCFTAALGVLLSRGACVGQALLTRHARYSLYLLYW